MLAYDKIIVDTSNIFYRVAAPYLKDLTTAAASQLMKSNTVFTQYVSAIDKLQEQSLGEICLLFDPMLSNGQMSARLKIKEGYKTTRDRNSPVAQLKMDTLEKLYSEFIMTARSRISVFHDVTLEADDFVEKLTETGKCLMMSADEDFARYLEEGRVEMLIKGASIKQDGIFTAADFEKKHGFKPNIVSVTFWKVLYGDPSDNVTGVFYDPSTKVIRTASEEMQSVLKDLGESNMTLSEAKIAYFNGTNRFKRFAELLRLSNTDRSYEKLLDLTDTNFKIIESMLPRSSDIDVNKYKVKLDLNLSNLKKKKFSLNKKEVKFE